MSIRGDGDVCLPKCIAGNSLFPARRMETNIKEGNFPFSVSTKELPLFVLACRKGNLLTQAMGNRTFNFVTEKLLIKSHALYSKQGSVSLARLGGEGKEGRGGGAQRFVLGMHLGLSSSP